MKYKRLLTIALLCVAFVSCAVLLVSCGPAASSSSANVGPIW